jgi:hypothetical protein
MTYRLMLRLNYYYLSVLDQMELDSGEPSWSLMASVMVSNGEEERHDGKRQQ